MDNIEELFSLVDLRILHSEDFIIGDPDGDHGHWDPINEFYNHCHGKAGKFCPTNGGGGGGGEGKVSGGKGKGVLGKSELPDSDGTAPVHTGTVKHGKHGGSLVDPNAGTRTIDGLAGYDSKGKPVAGSDAWLEAHGISRSVFNSRPYVKYEASKSDPALHEGYKEYPKAEKFFTQRAEQEGQTGGYLMYKHQVPGSPFGPIAPQARPNAPIITDMAKHSYAKKVFENDQARLATLKKTAPSALLKERRAQLKQANLHLERTKTATPEKIRAEADKNLAKAESALKKAKEGGDPVTIFEAKKTLVNEKRQHMKDLKKANNFRPDKDLHDAETSVRYAENRLQRSIDNPKGALEDEIKSQGRRVDRSENRYKKTAAKYVFPPGTSSARIDMNPDPRNVKNLTEGKGRIYFAMEGSIKADAIMTAARKEDPTAAVVNVPSVTLWQQKEGLTGGLAGGTASGEVKWFAQKYGKGREIVLIPDADGINNPNVMMQAKALSTALRSSGVHKVILAAPPLKSGTKKVIDHFNLPSGVDEGRKGIDDHLGAGRGQLSHLQYSNVTKVPKYSLTEYTKAAGGEGPKINRNSIRNTEAALAAISGIAGPEGATRMPKKMLAQTANLPLTSAKEARDRLEKLGIIKVEHIFDEQALSRGRRIRNPNVSEDRVNELVKKGIIKEPRLDEPFTEVSIEESPVITILDKRFVIKSEDVQTGTLADLSSWHSPKSYKGWTSPVSGKKDSTGIAAKQIAGAAKSIAKKEAAKPAHLKKAPPGRKVVRTQAGAKKYGVAIGDLIPVVKASGEVISVGSGLSSMIMIPLATDDLIEFYNHCHGKGGKFCPGSGGSGVSGKASLGGDWPASKGRNISIIAKAGRGSVKVDGIKAKAVYEITANNGNKIRLYDKTGKAGPYYKDLLQNHARMNEMYPAKPPHNMIVTKSGKGIDRRDISAVNSKINETYVNSDYLGFDIRGIKSGYLMPSAHSGNTKNMDYLMTHEYGHHVDFSKHVVGDTHTASALYSNPAFKNALSKYGKKSAVEAYAEAFAEWHYTRGRTKNPAAVSMARSEGWFGSGLTASILNLTEVNDWVSLTSEGLVHFSIIDDGGEIVEDVLSFDSTQFAINEGEMFPDDTEDDIYADIPSFDNGGVTVRDGFEEGSTVSGKEKAPSKEDVVKATEIVKQVFKDLGLDYEAYARGEVG